jgi:hypothetical protein
VGELADPLPERDSWMRYCGANHECTSEPKSCDPETNRRLCSVGSRFDVHETQRGAVDSLASEQCAERAVEEHDVVEPYGTSRQPPI